ncbi:hypothetical protein TRFO_36501 [Tritrichomonas foetus]|uniref:CLASP N-terminal domain-containing protein n=1 Tax=Tritrichomonas foetus TaxID=1144522 RepID=A0A1J4JDN7_9EUKA|nr:hypothetical protein TRFO_36501 [Tritrichomonas foetus]|eukprot:OHS97310.1 hypothetical protein TRFO_36501 [Tritrichomonas foetus]
MTTYLAKATLQSFTDSILKEAESSSGTWSLATYSQIKEKVLSFDSCESQFFFDTILERLIDTNTETHVRYKLSQLCCIIHSMNVPSIEEYFKSSQQTILKISEIQSDNKKPLYIASNKLLKSIYEDPVKRRFSIQPTSISLMRKNVTAISSKTPEPFAPK